MHAKELLDLGFQITGGQVDYQNKNYGQLLPSGALLTPEGEALVVELRAGATPAEAKPASTVKTAKAAKGVSPSSPTPASTEPPAAAPSVDDLDKLLEQ